MSDMLDMSELKPGKLESVSAGVRRIVAPNPGPMTGPGTNTYIVGNEQLAVIDPGPDIAEHIEAILSSTKAIGEIKWILVTHTHPDHSPAASKLAQLSGAQLLGPTATGDQFQDRSFKPEHEFAHDERLTGADFSIRALLTPGHVGNHVCYLIEEDQLLLTGDHIMSGSTVVIIPPGGDMKDYIASLALLKTYPLKCLGPGHGDLIADAYGEIDKLIAHRLWRESKVIDAMEQMRRVTLNELTPSVYDDVALSLHPIAQLSLLAHLLKLEKDGLVRHIDEYWLM